MMMMMMIIISMMMIMMVVVVSGASFMPEGAGYYSAIFVFGDSLTDNGNNNNLSTVAKAVRLPYGRDFGPSSGHPTGRFCNGPLTTDYLASFAGLRSPPPYMTAGDDSILEGVTFASSGAGILNSTSIQLGKVVSFAQQVSYFMDVKERIERRLGAEQGRLHIGKSLFFMCIGSNDYIANYLFGGPIRTPLQYQYSPAQYMELLLTNLEDRIKELYGVGARKFAMVGIAAVGCIPFELLMHASKDGECVESINEIVQAYNVGLRQRIEVLKLALPDARFTYLNSYDPIKTASEHPSVYGFVESKKGCCGTGPYHGIPCVIKTNARRICANASKYVFWDFVHPTAAFNAVIAKLFWEGSFPDVDPMNLKELASVL